MYHEKQIKKQREGSSLDGHAVLLMINLRHIRPAGDAVTAAAEPDA